MRRLAAAIMLAVFAVTVGVRATPTQPVVTGRWISGVSPFAPACSGATDAFGSTEVEPFIIVDHADPDRVVAVWQADRFASHGGAQSNLTAYSDDGGFTWTHVQVPGISVCTGGPWQRATDPWLDFGPSSPDAPEGIVYLASLSLDGQLEATWKRNALVVNRSLDGGRTWSQPSVVVDDPAVILNDKEAITADPYEPGTVYMIYARAFGVELVTHFTKSIDHGQTWTPPLPIVVTTGAVGAQGNELLVLPDGTLAVVYTTQTRIQIVRSIDGGTTWSAPVSIGNAGAEVTTRDGEPVRSAAASPTADVGPDGSIVVAWQANVGPTFGTVTYARSTDGGATWSEPAWAATPAGVVFTPALAIDDDGTIGIVYYDFRNDTAGDDRADTDVWMTWSRDDGATWSESHVAGPFDLYRAPFAEGYFLGDYIGFEAAGSVFQGAIPMTPGTGEGAATDIWSATIDFSGLD